MLLPFLQSKKLNSANNHPIVFAGDVGATKTNLALYKVENEQFRLLHQAKLVSDDFGSVAMLADHFMKNLPSPDAVCFGVAGPVLNGKAKLSNLSWEVDAHELSQHFGVHDIHLINDLEATAYGLAVLGKEDISIVHEGSAAPVGNVAVIAPGTGLGEAGLYWDGEYYRPFATEGGHCDFAPRDAFDFE
ncbi:MAG TPA: glucokinase, partial [Agriterribacter sp.]|nr:glucokinase [Agriterribacter sp.]